MRTINNRAPWGRRWYKYKITKYLIQSHGVMLLVQDEGSLRKLGVRPSEPKTPLPLATTIECIQHAMRVLHFNPKRRR